MSASSRIAAFLLLATAAATWLPVRRGPADAAGADEGRTRGRSRCSGAGPTGSPRPLLRGAIALRLSAERHHRDRRRPRARRRRRSPRSASGAGRRSSSCSARWCDLIDGELARSTRTQGEGGRLPRLEPRPALRDRALRRARRVASPIGAGAFWAVAALAASLMVSYARARGEGLGVECPTFGMERPHRVVLAHVRDARRAVPAGGARRAPRRGRLRARRGRRRRDGARADGRHPPAPAPRRGAARGGGRPRPRRLALTARAVRVCIVTPYDLSHEGGVNRHALGLAARAARPRPRGARRRPGERRGAGRAARSSAGVVPIPANGSVARIGLLVPRRRRRATTSRAAASTSSTCTSRSCRARRGTRSATRACRSSRPSTPTPSASCRSSARSARPPPARSRAVGLRDRRLARRRSVLARRLPRPHRGRSRTAWTSPASPAPPPARAARAAAARGSCSSGASARSARGFRLLLDAVALLAPRGREVAVDVVGAGPARALRGAARRARRALPRARSTTRSSPRATGPPTSSARRRSGGESFGMVLVEAMAAGCPVVASALPGYAEAARGAALLVPPGGRGRARGGALARGARRGAARAARRARAARGRGAARWSRVAARVLARLPAGAAARRRRAARALAARARTGTA